MGKQAIPKNPPCRKCGKPTKLHFSYRRDATRQYQWHCASCKRSWSPNEGSGYFIPHEIVDPLLKSLTPERLKGFEAERCLSDERVPCVVCGALGAQNHHFAPQSMQEYFGDDFEKYPQADLCEYHHRLWHEVVTWYLNGYPQRKQEFIEKYLSGVLV